MLRHLDAHVPLEVTWEQVTYFSPAEPARFDPEVMPLWIWMDDPSFYGFPTYGEPTVKAAQDCGGPPVDPDDRGEVVEDPGMLERLAALMGDGPARAPATRCGPSAASTRSRRTATSCWRRSPATRTSSSAWAPRTGSSSRRRSAGC